MPSLAEILAAKKEKARQQGEFIQETLPEIEALASPYQPSPVDPAFFFSVYSILIQHPYEVDLQAFRELRKFLLSEAQYVLNTFPQMSEAWLFDLLLRYNPPQQAIDLHKLWLVICELRLCVPASYIPYILALVASPRKIFFLQNSEIAV